MRNKIYLILLGTFIFIAFVLFSYLVHKDLFLYFDFDTTVRIQDKMPRRFDELLSSLSLFGSFEITTVILLALLVVTRKLKSILVMGGYVAFHIFELYGKIFVNHPGPPYLFFRYDIPFMFPSSYVQPGSSYPSGHSGRTAFISVILMFLVGRSKRLKPMHKVIVWSIILSFDIAMFVSRVYLGEHWISDVIGGALLGLALAIASLIFF